MNSDQVGFRYEHTAKRTHDRKSTKKVVANIHSSSKTTHSYTINFLISASGHLKDMFIIFQEQKELSERVKQKLPSYPHAIITWNRSGKMDNIKIESWIKNVLKPSLPDGTVLLYMDSLKTQLKQEMYDRIIGGGRIKLMQIPEHTTPDLQPLDLRFNLQYKNAYKKIISVAFEHHFDYTRRENIIIIHCLLHHQFSHEKFHPLIKKSFAVSRLIEDDNDYGSPSSSKILFSFPSSAKCVDCNDYGIIECTHCNHILCFTHFVHFFHIHE